VYALGQDRFRITWPKGDREVEGYDEADRLAHELADRPPR
jgi:ribonuclease HI